MTDTTTTTAEVRERLVEYVRTHPEQTISSIASKLEIGCSTLTKLLADAGYHRRQYHKLANIDLAKLGE
jgi:DNA-binding NtrC family response regulator